MSLLTARMVEPCIKGDEIILTVIDEAGFRDVAFAELHANKASKEEIALYEDLAAFRWPLPANIRCDWKSELKSLKDIEMNITRYLRRYIYLRDARQYSILSAWVISTYFRDQFFYAPLLIFDGLTTSGKSTAIYALSQICYRGELFDSASGPAVAREIEDYGSTILLDEVLDALAGDRGTDLFTMLKSSFGKWGTWVRADPKGRKNYRYRTYSHIALSIKGDTLPEDLYNRSIRINMVAAPSHVALDDVYNWREDDSGRESSPDTIRTDLYRLMAYSRAHPEPDRALEVTKYTVNFAEERMMATRDVTIKTESGQYFYAYVNGLPADSPAIRARDRNIANTLYAVGLKVDTGTDIISVIVDNAKEQREAILDTPEALAYVSMVELIDEFWDADRLLYPEMDRKMFIDYVSRISTSCIAKRFNGILEEQGNAGRDPVHTRTVTAKINAMGFAYTRSGARGGNKSWLVPTDPYFVDLFLRYLRVFTPERYADFRDISVNKT